MVEKPRIRLSLAQFQLKLQAGAELGKIGNKHDWYGMAFLTSQGLVLYSNVISQNESLTLEFLI